MGHEGRWWQRRRRRRSKSRQESASLARRAASPLGNASFPYPLDYSSSLPQVGGKPWPSENIEQALLLQRDLALVVPINRVAYPFVNLTSSHFVTSFTNENVTNVGNLLNFGYRRFGLNLYWNALTARFQICPVDVSGLPTTGSDNGAALVSNQGYTCLTQDPGLDGVVRQIRNWIDDTNSFNTQFDFVQLVLTLLNLDISRTVKSLPTPTSTSASSSSLSASPFSLFSGSSSAMASSSVSATMSSFAFASSSVSATSSQTAASAPTSTSGVLGSIVANGAGSYLLTPVLLDSWRSDLNSSFSIEGMAYFDTQSNSSGYFSTSDGWPTPYYLFHSEGKRLLVAIDPTLTSFNGTRNSTDLPLSFGLGSNSSALASNVRLTLYDASDDLSRVFGPGDLNLYPLLPSMPHANASVISLSDTNGFDNCSSPVQNVVLYETGGGARSAVNAKPIAESLSWIEVNDDANAIWTVESVGAAARCGFSFGVERPFSTLSQYAETNGGSSSMPSTSGYSTLAPFDLIAASVWTWDAGQPEAPADSLPAASVQGGAQSYATSCAAMQASNGRWMASDCTQAYRVACRLQGNLPSETYGLPFGWVLGDRATFFDAPQTCSDLNATASFSVPFIAKENNALLAAVQESGDVAANDRIWISVNSISVPDCWAIGDSSVECPYATRTVRSTGTIVIVSLVAGIIVLSFTAFFIYFRVKRWHRNRSERRRQQRAMSQHESAGFGANIGRRSSLGRMNRGGLFAGAGGQRKEGPGSAPVGYRPIRPDDPGEWEGIAA